MSTAGRGHGEDMKKTGQVIFLRVISDIAFFTGVHEIHGNLLEKEGKIMCQHVCLFFFFPQEMKHYNHKSCYSQRLGKKSYKYLL